MKPSYRKRSSGFGGARNGERLGGWYGGKFGGPIVVRVFSRHGEHRENRASTLHMTARCTVVSMKQVTQRVQHANLAS